jgi:hypothetical protein
MIYNKILKNSMIHEKLISDFGKTGLIYEHQTFDFGKNSRFHENPRGVWQKIIDQDVRQNSLFLAASRKFCCTLSRNQIFEFQNKQLRQLLKLKSAQGESFIKKTHGARSY